MKFRKKPVVIDAIQIHKAMDVHAPEWFKEALANGTVRAYGLSVVTRDQPYVVIRTPEGDMCGNANDWVIRGVKGELYPCKNEIFKVTYDAAE